jgi:hypothetical protein
MLSRMASNSKKRGHPFDWTVAKAYLMCALMSAEASGFRCGCKHPRCRVTMCLYGQHALSPDRKHDHLSYTDDEQIVTFVAKDHNTSIKHDSLPRVRKSQKCWVGRTASSMAKHTCDRAAMLRSKGDNMSVNEREQVARFDKEQVSDFKRYEFLKELLRQKRAVSQKCRDCDKSMYFGDNQGILRLCNVGHQASPDRRNNDNIFYDAENFDLVCISCNLTENRGGRTFVEHMPRKHQVEFTPERTQECLKWLA